MTKPRSKAPSSAPRRLGVMATVGALVLAAAVGVGTLRDGRNRDAAGWPPVSGGSASVDARSAVVQAAASTAVEPVAPDVVDVDVLVPPAPEEAAGGLAQADPGPAPDEAESPPDPAAPTVDAAAGGQVVADVAAAATVETPVIESDAFSLVGITWPKDQGSVDIGAEVRTRTGETWSPWTAMPVSDDGPDAGTADAASAVRTGTDPLWVGSADAVQARFPASDEGGPDGMRLVLVDPGTTTGATPAVGPASAIRTADFTSSTATTARTADFTSSTATTARTVESGLGSAVSSRLGAAAPAPGIISRAAWGADESLRTYNAGCGTPEYSSTLLFAVLHHTASANGYSSVAQAMAEIRAIYAYHVKARGWCDIGYNFIVDKWGNVYEGRAGGVDRPVKGVHSGGFNTDSLGVSMLGDYSSVVPSAATQESVAQVIAWRLSSYHRDPMSTVGYTTWGGENSRYAAGTWLALPVIIGHRDVAYTACPGGRGYGTISWLRARARALIGASFVNPALAATSIPMGGSATVTGGVLSTIDWTLQVVDARTGVEMQRTIGVAATSGGGAIATWNGRYSTGDPVGPGSYRLTLTGTEHGTGAAVVPWTGIVQVTGSQDPPAVAAVALAHDLRFVPITPARLFDSRPTGQSLGPKSRMDLQVTGRAGVPADAKAVALNVTAVNSSTVTFLRVWPAGQPAPGASALNTDERRTTGSGVMVGVGGQGKVSIFNNLGSTHLVVDITGYYTDAPAVGDAYQQLAAGARVLDTRKTGGPMVNGERRTVQVAGKGGIPADATAVAVNVSSVMSQGAGNISAFPSGGAVPGTASVNHLPGNDVSNRTIVPLAGGRLDLLLTGGRADVVLDVVGWFGPSATMTFTPISPVRAFDTRTGGSPLGQGASRAFPIVGLGGIPADARVAVIALAATQQSAVATFVTLWASGGPRPATSDLNTGSGRDQANFSLTAWGPDGRIQAYNNAGTTHLVGDVFGYFR